jgi:hypothetical protein
MFLEKEVKIMRRLVILGLVVLIACAKQQQIQLVPRWTMMDKDQQAAWLQLALHYPHCPSDRLPPVRVDIPVDDTEGQGNYNGIGMPPGDSNKTPVVGVWVDDGMGYWHYIGTSPRVVPFSSPTFRVAWMGPSDRWPFEAELFEYIDPSLKRVATSLPVALSVGYLTTEVSKADAMGANLYTVYQIRMSIHAQNGFYQFDPRGDVPDLVYADPALSTMTLTESQKAEYPTEVRMYDNRGKDILRTEWGAGFLGSVPMVSKKPVVLDVSMGADFPVYSHWAAIIGAMPEVLVQAQAENVWEHWVIFQPTGEVLFPPVWPVLDSRKSTNFRACFRCLRDKTYAGAPIQLGLGDQRIKVTFRKGESR